MYHVKTRNWNCKKWTANALNKIALIFGVSVYPASDNDNKYYLNTKSAFRAWGAWVCFMALQHFSGGWTYIVRPNGSIDGDYKSIY